MHGNAFTLGDELAVRVQDSGGKIAAGVEDLRHRRAQHDLSHFQGDGAETMLHHGEGDGIRLFETCRVGLILGEHVECHVQLNAAVRVNPGGIAGFDHDRGKRRFEECWPWNIGAR
jgi:hypothetical protein